MQDKYFLTRKAEFFSEKKVHNTFMALLKNIDIASLKKTPEFEKITQAALPKLTSQILFSKVAISAVQRNMLGTLVFLINDCGFKDLISCGDENGNTLLHEACLHDKREIIDFFLSRGADINVTNNNKDTPLSEIVEYSHLASLISKLKEAGANVNARNSKGLTPLHLAAVRQNHDAIRELRRCGANVHMKNNNTDYLGYLRQVQAGIIKVSPLARIVVPEEKSEVAAAHYVYGFLFVQRKVHFFQEAVKDIIACQEVLEDHQAMNLADSYFLGNSGDSIGKFIEKNFKAKKLTLSGLTKAFLRIALFHVQEGSALELNGFLQVFIKILKDQGQVATVLQPLNELMFLANLSGLYHLIDQLADYTLPLLPLFPHPEHNYVKNQVLFNYAISLRNRLIYDKRIVILEQAIAFKPDDTETFLQLVACYQDPSQYQQIEKLCANVSIHQDLRVIAKTHSQVIGGKLGAREALAQLPKDSFDHETKLFLLDTKAHLHQLLGENDLALQANNEAFSCSVQVINNVEQDFTSAVYKRIKMLLECHKYQEALNFVKNCKEKYRLHNHNVLLKTYTILTYTLNGLFEESEILIDDLVRSEFPAGFLSRVLTDFALQVPDTQKIDNPFTQRNLELAIKIDPNNISAKLFYYYLLKVRADQKHSEEIKTEFDPEFLNNSAIQNNLLVDPDKQAESKAEEYDPVKIHQFFQTQKKQRLALLSEELCKTPKSVSKWTLKGNTFCTNSENVVSLNSDLHPNHYAVIDPAIKLDEPTLKRMKMALNKGVCKRSREQNGIKFLRGCVVELKIDEDIRLEAHALYKNKQGDVLVFFDRVGNHQTVQNALAIKKPLTIISLSEEPEVRVYRGMFFTTDDKRDVTPDLDKQQLKMDPDNTPKTL